jgi:pimeloyl-ACP methyl ester carboxylesterase
LLAGEAPRAASELASFLIARRRLAKGPSGDGRPILVLPGLAGADGSTRALRRLLRQLGFFVHAWRLGRNWGPTDRIIDGLGERVRALISEHGQPITMIGHSLGGIYAREIARAAPEGVRQVITLGSPMRRPPGTMSAAAPLFQALSPLHSERVKDVDPDRIRRAIPVPLTAIFTRTDGVVPWRICLVDPGDLSENIEVRGSHSGLIHNPSAVTVILDRLGLEEWRPYVEVSGVGARVWVEREER